MTLNSLIIVFFLCIQGNGAGFQFKKTSLRKLRALPYVEFTMSVPLAIMFIT